jgi:uncharacterized membrane protein
VADLFRITAQFLHVFAGILWIGGGVYSGFVQLPAVLAAPPAARGAVMAQLGPRQVRYLLRAGEVTIATGVLNLIATGRAQQLTDPLGSRWAIVLLLGILLAIGLYVLLRTAVAPRVAQMLSLGPKAAGGDAAAAAEVAQIVTRLRTLSFVQVGIGVLIILAMVTARLS